MKQTDIARVLANAPDGNRFWCNDGLVFSNLKELAAALKKMNDNTYSYHANAEKNDFSNWTNDIFGDSKLALALLKCKNKKKAAKAIEARISQLKKRKKSKK